MTKLPNAWMTWPAAAVPSCPCARMRRVEARLSAKRSMVAISSTVGNAENSSGAWMNSAVIRISTERMIETARNRSSRTGGSGRIRTTRMVITPTASAMSPRLRRSAISPRLRRVSPSVAPCAAVTSLIRIRPYASASPRYEAGRDRSFFASPWRGEGEDSRHAAYLAAARRRDRHAVGGIFVELVAQGADRDAQDVGRVGAVAEAVLERFEDQVALDVGDGAPHERARHLLGRVGRVRDRGRDVARIVEASAVRRQDRFGPDLRPAREQHGAMDGVFEFAHVAGPAVDHQLAPRLRRQRPQRQPVALGVDAAEMLREFQHVGGPLA